MFILLFILLKGLSIRDLLKEKKMMLKTKGGEKHEITFYTVQLRSGGKNLILQTFKKTKREKRCIFEEGCSSFCVFLRYVDFIVFFKRFY